MKWIDDDGNKDLRRNTLSIRFTDQEHRTICDAAWRNRISASSMIRDILLGEIEQRGLTTGGHGGYAGHNDVLPVKGRGKSKSHGSHHQKGGTSA
jgi:hypothetical protein